MHRDRYDFFPTTDAIWNDGYQRWHRGLNEHLHKVEIDRFSCEDF